MRDHGEGAAPSPSTTPTLVAPAHAQRAAAKGPPPAQRQGHARPRVTLVVILVACHARQGAHQAPGVRRGIGGDGHTTDGDARRRAQLLARRRRERALAAPAWPRAEVRRIRGAPYENVAQVAAAVLDLVDSRLPRDSFVRIAHRVLQVVYAVVVCVMWGKDGVSTGRPCSSSGLHACSISARG
eukprot:2967159-Prymnesium_polylepis.1